MHIPADILPTHLGEGEPKIATEGMRTVPVESSAGLRSTLSQMFSTQYQNVGIRGNAALALLTGASPGEERRQHERRQQNLPALLDTRLRQRRKESGSYPSVNFNI
ncbi:MAG: hypothetical protein J0653_05620 [Deltaproteobacteria bacterium]|nr:hypothetical protein [Deltaproteobacteria bacterium]